MWCGSGDVNIQSKNTSSGESTFQWRLFYRAVVPGLVTAHIASEFGMEVWVVEGVQIQSNQFTDFPLIYVIDF